MARIVGGNPNGEFRGKLGGLVYSRNRSGQIVRNYAKPIDPRSLPQLAARAAFAQAMSGFHTMTETEKSAWNAFANAYFTSKGRGNVPSVHSGANAFVALRNNLLNADRLTSDVSDIVININGTPATAVGQETINLISVAPTETMQGVLGSGFYAINSGFGFAIASGDVTFGLNLTGAGVGPVPGPSPSTGSIFTDGQGYNVGFNVYMSNPLIQEGVHVSNPDVILLGSTGIIDSYTTPSVITSSVEVTFPIIADVGNSSYAPNPGNFYQLSAWMFNSQGQTIKVASAVVQVV